MRKRSKYRPKPVLQNPLGYVLEGIAPVTSHKEYLLSLRIKNHGALTAIMQGSGTRQDVNTLIEMANVTEALVRLGKGAKYITVVEQGMAALHELGVRGIDTERYILRAGEITALNLLIELHDAQMDICIVKDIERAIDLVRQEARQKKMTRIARPTSAA